MRRTTTTLLTLVATASLLAACGTEGGDDPATGGTEETTASAEPTSEEPTSEAYTDEPTSEAPTDEQADGPAFPDSTADQEAEQTDAALLLVDVRLAAHDGFDRLVLEFEGEGEPGWLVGYVDDASTQGKGDPITVEGDAMLSVAARHTMPDDMTGFYEGPQMIELDGEAIEEVFVDGTFEGQTIVVVGVDDADNVFRVFPLTEPTRLVVDVEDTAD